MIVARQAVDPTAERAQEMMPPPMSLGWLLADTTDVTDPDRNQKRDSNVLPPAMKSSSARRWTMFASVGQDYPRFGIELDIEVKAVNGTLIERLEDVYRYEGEVRHRVPIDADNFRNWIVAKCPPLKNQESKSWCFC